MGKLPAVGLWGARRNRRGNVIVRRSSVWTDEVGILPLIPHIVLIRITCSKIIPINAHS